MWAPKTGGPGSDAQRYQAEMLPLPAACILAFRSSKAIWKAPRFPNFFNTSAFVNPYFSPSSVSTTQQAGHLTSIEALTGDRDFINAARPLVSVRLMVPFTFGQRGILANENPGLSNDPAKAALLRVGVNDPVRLPRPVMELPTGIADRMAPRATHGCYGPRRRDDRATRRTGRF